jgi:predicted lipid-binding transport protein (Tim44 family)
MATLAFIVTEADARSRGSFGSRGARTHSAPAPTATAPNQARPMERTMTQPGQPGSVTAARPATAPGAQPGGLFNRPGFLGGLAAGFLGAGLIGLLMGHGFAGGLGGLASFFGLLLQIGLVVIVGYLLWTWWQRRTQPAAAMAGGPSPRDIAPEQARTYGSNAAMGLGGGSVPSMAPAANAASASDEIGIQPADFDAFERLLGEIQTAYGAEDLAALRARVTPEMLSYFAEDLAANTSRGVANKISDVKLLQGDLSEAWREGNTEYATVAMRYSLVDQMVDRASGRVTEGGADEATEVWTFMRARGGQWVLSAIQQV